MRQRHSCRVPLTAAGARLASLVEGGQPHRGLTCRRMASLPALEANSSQGACESRLPHRDTSTCTRSHICFAHEETSGVQLFITSTLHGSGWSTSRETMEGSISGRPQTLAPSTTMPDLPGADLLHQRIAREGSWPRP